MVAVVAKMKVRARSDGNKRREGERRETRGRERRERRERSATNIQDRWQFFDHKLCVEGLNGR